MNFNHIADRITGDQRIINAVMALCHSIADICCKISGCFSSLIAYPIYGFIHQLQQMSASRMTVPKGAFNHDLHFRKVLYLPAHTHPKRVHFRSQFPNILTNHNNAPFLFMHL